MILPVMRLTEKHFAAQVDKLAEMFNWRWWHDRATNAPRACPRCHAAIHLPRNDPGFPDRVLIRGDTLWFVELKTDRSRPTEAQLDWLEALMAVKKIRVGLWRPRDVENIVEWLR